MAGHDPELRATPAELDTSQTFLAHSVVKKGAAAPSPAVLASIVLEVPPCLVTHIASNLLPAGLAQAPLCLGCKLRVLEELG